MVFMDCRIYVYQLGFQQSLMIKLQRGGESKTQKRIIISYTSEKIINLSLYSAL